MDALVSLGAVRAASCSVVERRIPGDHPQRADLRHAGPWHGAQRADQPQSMHTHLHTHRAGSDAPARLGSGQMDR